MILERILVVDDEAIIRNSLQELLRKRRYSVSAVGSLREAEDRLRRDQFDVVFLDIRLPDGDGIKFLERLAREPESPITVMMTGHGSVQSAVECMRLGAFDYILKPLSLDHIKVVLKKAESYDQLVRVNRFLSQDTEHGSEIIGNSHAMQHLKRMVRKVAATEATVLITGENGTGKELVGSELFRLSPRSNQPYIKVNCAAISESLIESEFFGHEKGSFTGATQKRVGRFELANNGTILLDEIGEISSAIQVKLLRVLQEREFERVGGNKTIRVNVRVIATTNRDLVSAVERGDFREDLYYRLNVFPLHIAALRDRKEDITLLANQFLKSFTRKHGLTTPGFSQESISCMNQYNWPGNVRELQNTVERAVILTGDNEAVEADSLGILGRPGTGGHFRRPQISPPSTSVEQSVDNPKSEVEVPKSTESGHTGNKVARIPVATPGFVTLVDMERQHILGALIRTGGNRKEASEILSISPRTLRSKLQQYREAGFDVP